MYQVLCVIGITIASNSPSSPSSTLTAEQQEAVEAMHMAFDRWRADRVAELKDEVASIGRSAMPRSRFGKRTRRENLNALRREIRRLSEPTEAIVPPLTWRIGSVGLLQKHASRWNVIQVIDEERVLAHQPDIDRTVIFVVGTAKLTNDSGISFSGKSFWVKEIATYDTVLGSTNTVFVLHIFDDAIVAEYKRTFVDRHNPKKKTTQSRRRDPGRDRAGATSRPRDSSDQSDEPVLDRSPSPPPDHTPD